MIARIGSQVPVILALLGIGVIGFPFIFDSIYFNFFVAGGSCLLFAAWIIANILQGRFQSNSPQGKEKQKVLIAMSLCFLVGVGMLIYYEMQMPRYKVALISKKLYQVPPQLSKKQLLELGRECNTYGNTLCSHDVFAKIVRIDPRDYGALANLAMAQSHLGFHKYAIQNFERALKNGARAWDVYKFYGHSLKATENFEQASQAYKASLKLNPNQTSLKQIVDQLSSQ